MAQTERMGARATTGVGSKTRMEGLLVNRDEIIRKARETRAARESRPPDIYSGDKPVGSTRGFWLFWLRPEGGVYKPGFNLTILRGFALALVAFGKKYRFRYRKNISPKFLWSVE